MSRDSEVGNAQQRSDTPDGLRSLRRGALSLIPVGVLLTLLGLTVYGPNGAFNAVALVAGLITLSAGILCSIAQQAVRAIVDALGAASRRDA